MNRATKTIGTAAAFLLFALAAAAQAPTRRPITVQDLLSIHRVSDPQISPDGQWVAYTVATPDLAANHISKNIWIVPARGGDPRQLTSTGSDERPRWSPDGKTIAFLSSRDGAAQIYAMPSDRRRANPHHFSLRGRGQRTLVARRQMDRLHLPRLSRLRRRRLQRPARRAKKQQPGEGPRLR